MVYVQGFVVAVPLFVFTYLSLQARERLWISSTYAIGILGLIVGFETFLERP